MIIRYEECYPKNSVSKAIIPLLFAIIKKLLINFSKNKKSDQSES